MVLILINIGVSVANILQAVGSLYARFFYTQVVSLYYRRCILCEIKDKGQILCMLFLSRVQTASMVKIFNVVTYCPTLRWLYFFKNTTLDVLILLKPC